MAIKSNQREEALSPLQCDIRLLAAIFEIFIELQCIGSQ